MKYNLLVILISSILFFFYSCSKFNSNVTNISHYGEKSHNMGRNCMDCHINGGPGKGWFTIAGTAYDTTFTKTYPNATVRLYTQPNGLGTLTATVEVDAKGNFHTTDYVNFGTGLYPTITGIIKTYYMTTPITQGACNGCHNFTTCRICTK